MRTVKYTDNHTVQNSVLRNTEHQSINKKKIALGNEAKKRAAEQKKKERKAAVAATLAGLPSDLGRNRVLDAAAASAFWGVSLPHWRRLYRTGKVPHPIKIGERKLGWRIGTLADGLAARDGATAA